MPMTEHVKDILQSKYPEVAPGSEFFKFLEKKQHDNDVLSNPAFEVADVERCYAEFHGTAHVTHQKAVQAKESTLSAREQAEKDMADAKARLDALDEQAKVATKAESDSQKALDKSQPEPPKKDPEKPTKDSKKGK
jgi:hypothetical protein